MVKVISVEKEPPWSLALLVHALMMPPMRFDEPRHNRVACLQGNVPFVGHQVMHNEVNAAVNRDPDTNEERSP